MRHKRLHSVLAAIIAVALISGAALAADDYGQQRQNSWQKQQKQQSQQQQGRNRQMSYQLDPQSWMLVGYDLNNDGTVDAYEYISLYELERARQASRDRMQQQQQRQGQGRQGMMGRGQMDQRQQMRRRQQMPQGRQMRQGQGQNFRIQGEIRDLTTFSINDQRHQFAKIDTQAGRTIRADLGPVNQLRKLDLQDSDSITVWGQRGTVDGKDVLLADRVSSNGRRLSIDRQQSQDNRTRLSGTVQATRTIRTQQDNQHLVARLQDSQGRTTWVDLGPPQDLRQIDIQRGDRIRVLGYEMIKGGRPVALVATDVTANGRQVSLDWFGSREQLRSKIQQSQDQQGRNVSLRGTLQNTRTIQTDRGPHLVAMIETPEGRTAWADLGDARQAQRAQLSQGDKLEIRGTELFKGGRPVAVRAKQFTANNKQYNVSRPRQQQSQPWQQDRQQWQRNQQNRRNEPQRWQQNQQWQRN